MDNQTAIPIKVERGAEPYEVVIRRLCEMVLRNVAPIMDLSPLEAITVSGAYEQSVAQIDRGFEATELLTPTAEPFAAGKAMVAHVKRGDRYKCHLILDLQTIIDSLSNDDKEANLFPVFLIMHELAHVDDAATFHRIVTVPHSLSPMEMWLFRVSQATWSEYFASYKSAAILPSQINNLVDNFLGALDRVPNELDQEISSYRLHADIEHLAAVAADRVGLLFKFAGYVIGHLAGLKTPASDLRSEFLEEIDDATFRQVWDRLSEALPEMHQTHKAWSNLDVFKPLNAVVFDYLAEVGIELSDQDSGIYFNIPYR